jgi:hypothetical protein
MIHDEARMSWGRTLTWRPCDRHAARGASHAVATRRIFARAYPACRLIDAMTAGAKASSTRWQLLGWVVAWLWALVAGGGGLLLLITQGPLPLTNGWFALFSGIAACPLTAALANRMGLALSGRVRLAAAVLLWLAGQIARLVGI